MTPEQQRVAIAEIMGYKKGHGTGWVKDDLDGWLDPNGKFIGHEGHLPDFLSDRNAIFEAIMGLNDDERYTFGESLAKSFEDPLTWDREIGCYVPIDDHDVWKIITAPTDALCKAFLVAKGVRV